MVDISPGKILVVAAVVAMGYYHQVVMPNSASHPNAPDGAIEYVESGDGSEYVTLFSDSLIVGNDEREIEVPLSSVRRVQTHGYILKVWDVHDRELEVNLPSTQMAHRFEDAIQESID